VANWPVPKNKTQLKSFLSLTGFFRQFVPQNAKVAYPLSELLGKKKPDKLTELQICLSPCLSCLTPRKLWRQQYWCKGKMNERILRVMLYHMLLVNVSVTDCRHLRRTD